MMFAFNTSTSEAQWLAFFLWKEYFSFDEFGGQRWQKKHGQYLKALEWQSCVTAQEFLVSKFLFRLVLYLTATGELYMPYSLLYIQLPHTP